MRWDLFCQVIDNHGDAGVCWRLAAALGARGHAVRLWIDDPAMLRWMAPAGAPGVEVVHWHARAPVPGPGDVVVECFGCDPPLAFVARMAAADPAPAWLNLEYLSAEGYVERSHGLPSPVMQGPGKGLVKRFVYPGFTPRTGGLLREAELPARRAGFQRGAWLHQWGIEDPQAQVLSLFCYEPAALPELLGQLRSGSRPTELLVTAGRAAAAVRAAGVAPGGNLRLRFLPLLDQRDYDHLLWSCDLNFVRGEDSFVRALLAGVPSVWQAYPQQDGAHHAKLQAFLHWLQPPQQLRDFFLAWNGIAGTPLPAIDVAAWSETARRARERAGALPELSAELERFARGALE
ncbi:elongation factor P maturation arginine rhamnosyltransferase EarP [Ramlibacter sp. PS3R-8]|uniref:elongation factor P maturation arginine rhamnosyltransferase EarP n=1 Tax=Ramlibacter sp. PS3R-8 TaxID=3133437 RepID=UPI0030B6ED17